MLLLLLLHLVIFHLLTAREAPPHKDTKYVIKQISTCPSVGYFFKRDFSPNSLVPGPCYLCFCQEDNTAICWKRDNIRCDAESFHYHGIGKRDTRVRRSPGFADLFFRDAARDVFNKNSKPECKPFESSFSDDCPPARNYTPLPTVIRATKDEDISPESISLQSMQIQDSVMSGSSDISADWCTGCTVCDCDANGHWDCHLLSFCPDDKAKKKPKRKGYRPMLAKKPVKKTKTYVPQRVPSKVAKNNKTVNKGKPKTIPPIKHGGNKKVTPQKRIVKKSAPYKQTPAPQKRRIPIRYKRISPSKAEPTKTMIIKKNIATHKPIDIGASKVNLEMEIAQKVMKKVMANLRKSITGEIVNITKMATTIAQMNNPKNIKKKPAAKPKPNQKPKKVNKRQVKKPQRRPPYRKPANKKPNKPTKKPIKKPVKKPIKKPVKKPISNPPNKYVRNKRDVNMTEDNEIPTIYVDANPPESTNTTVLYSITPVTSNLPGLRKNCSHTEGERNTLPENEYYKYIVGIEHPQVTVNETLGVEGTTQVNRTETVFNLIGTQMTPIMSTDKSVIKYNENGDTITNITEINPEANDLKYSKWSHLKILKEKKIKSSSDKHKSLVKLITHSNKTIVLQDSKKKVHGKEVERRLNSRKFNIVKLLNIPKCNEKRNESKNSSYIKQANKKITNLQNLLANILKEFHKNSTTNPRKKNKKFSVLRYLKSFFNKIFKRKKMPDKFSKHHLIRTLCENFGPCRVSKRDRIILDAKLTDLDVETTKILRIVKIIKGLLKLVELPKSIDTDSSNQENNFRNDIQKLNVILKKSYAREDSVPLSATQLTQIQYIKQNTQDFIQSVSKFASLLNEIIAILTKDATIHSKINIRIPKSNIISKHLTKEDPFQSLRLLLERYNLIQNSFMKRIYEQINNFENKMNEKPKVSEVNSQELNNSVAIENFSRNIIQNLRKLKRLAQTVSSSGRTKRETMKDDDAIEYLLMFMEYLLKQNHPLDAAPVNDGIDLLIEAIKNAPDIKPIRKKVLENTPVTYSDSTTTTSLNFISYGTTESSLSEDDSPSESDKTSSEDSARIIKIEDSEDNKNKVEDNKELVEIIAEDDKDNGDKFQFDRRAGNEKVDDITEVAFYKRVDDNVVLESDSVFETTTMLAIEMETNDKLENQEDVIMDKPILIESNNLDKPSEEGGAQGGDDEKKIEVFTGDMEELILPGANIASEAPTTMTTELSTQARKSRTKMRHLTLESYDSESVDKKSKLEWIEENFGRENEKEITDFEENNATTLSVTPKLVSNKVTEKADVSSLTKEVIDEADKKRRAKINAEEVMLRKQMDLLNSLDYGTEKGELYESDSKDSNTDDRYSNDPYPAYFV